MSGTPGPSNAIALRANASCSHAEAILDRRTPDFQTEQGYTKSAPGKANLAMSTNQVAERFGATSMTLEMPYKDNPASPEPEQGWSPERCKMLARDCLASLVEFLDNEGV